MKGVKFISEELILQAAKNYGKGSKDLEEAFKAGFKSCLDLTNVSKIKLPDEYDRRKKLTEGDIINVRKLRNDGYTLKEIAVKYNVTVQCILYHTDDQFNKKQKEMAKTYYKGTSKAKRKAMSEAGKRSKEYKRLLKLKGLI